MAISSWNLASVYRHPIPTSIPAKIFISLTKNIWTGVKYLHTQILEAEDTEGFPDADPAGVLHTLVELGHHVHLTQIQGVPIISDTLAPSHQGDVEEHAPGQREDVDVGAVELAEEDAEHQAQVAGAGRQEVVHHRLQCIAQSQTTCL